MKKSKNPYVLKNEQFAKKYKEFKRNGSTGTIELSSDLISDIKIFGDKKHHTFFGYYDLQQIDSSGTKMLVIRAIKHANPKINRAKVYYITLDDMKYHHICNTRAWCWQQGARIRWSETNKDCIYINDKKGKKYVCKLINIYTKKIIHEFKQPFYDMNEKLSIGLSLNFSRLQRMRPGYGYSSLKDDSKKDVAPVFGIIRYNLFNNEQKNIVSLKSLSKDADCAKDDHHYINHICFSPDGLKFMFFHLWAKDGIEMWKMRLLVSDLDGNIMELEKDDIISHYCWLNNDELMVTKISNHKEHCFLIYNVITGLKRIIKNDYLVQDGHPVLIDNERFIVDTYPDEKSTQELFISDFEDANSKKTVLRIFSDPRLYIEKRCDLHPRLDIKNELISVDSTFSDGCRKVVLMKVKI